MELALVVDEAATLRARDAERAARMQRGRPFREFVADWVKAEPPPDIPYYGSWDDPAVIYAGVGPGRITMARGDVRGVMMADPKDVRIAQLEAELAALKGGRA